jgi:hypothetical protein
MWNVGCPQSSERLGVAQGEGIATLLSAADEILSLAKRAQAEGNNHAALCLALYGNEYVRAARAMQDMHDAFAEAGL